MEPKTINLKDKFKKFSDHWSPHIIGELNGQYVKLAKIKGEFDWHAHQEEDELFLVIEGGFEMHLESGIQTLKEGEMMIIPKGCKHKPVAKQEAKILLFEPKETVNTGNADQSQYKKLNLPWI